MTMNDWLRLARRAVVPVACVVAVLLIAVAVRKGCEPTQVTVTVAQAGEGAAAEKTAEPQAEQWWTCAMHPSVRQPGPGLCRICNMALVPVQEEASGGGLRRFVTGEAAAKLMEIETSPVERRLVVRDVRMVGKVDYDETRMTDITAWIPGRLDRLYVDFTGIRVARGDHMVEIYSPKLLEAQEELLQALTAVKELANSGIADVRRTAADTVEAARDKLRLLGLKPEQIRVIEERGDTTDYVTIYAPAGGVVVTKHAQEGAYVQTGAPLYTIADLSRLWVQMDAYESDLPWLAYGQPVTIRSEAYPGDTFAGRVSFISPVLNEKTRTVKVRANVMNMDDKLKPGMFVRAVVEATVASDRKVMDPALEGKWICPMHPGVVSDGPGACDVCGMALVRPESLGYVASSSGQAVPPLVIPASAPLVTGTRAVVYVAVPDAERPTFEGREVVLGPRAGDFYIVRHGLDEGDMVVTKGNFKIDSALQIQAKPSMMQPASAAAGGMQMAMDHPAHEQTPETAEAGAALERFKRYVGSLEALGQGILQALKDGDLEAARTVFADLGEALERAPATGLDEDTRPMWDEVSMLLGNDAFEGARVATLEEAREVGALLREHLQRTGEMFGVAVKVEEPVVEASGELIALFRPTLDEYLAFKEALSSDDEAEAAERAADLARAVSAAVQAEVEGADADCQQVASELAVLATNVQMAADIDGMRAGLAPLSLKLADIVRQFGVSERPLYLLFCPMASNMAGAYWLQTDEGIRNPYFGAQMPTCGEVVEQLGGRPGGAPAAVAQEAAVEKGAAVGQGAAEAPAEMSMPPAPSPGVGPGEFRPVLDAYLAFVRDLNADNAEAAYGDAAALADAVSEAAGRTPEAGGPLRRDLDALGVLTGNLKEAEGIAGLRAGLAPLSATLADMVRRFNLSDRPLYLIHCPMAFGGAGADWLQSTKVVGNPYFGSQMPTCGEVIEELGGPKAQAGGGNGHE